MRIYKNIFDKIVSLENLFSAWDKFKSDKQKKRDVQRFEWQLEENIFKLHRDLKDKIYKHGDYQGFYISDPKQRHIRKATVRDRILHHAVFAILNPIFEPTFISNSLSCRIGKGTHKGIDILEKLTRQTSNNAFKPCFVLKCDIKKFFETVDHSILLRIIRKRIKDADAMWLLEEIIDSFASQYSTLLERKGLPIDFLGYIVLPHHRLLRTKTRQRIFRKLKKRINEYKTSVINEQTLKQSLQSYLGVLSHANTYKLSNELKNQFWFWLNE
jgi:retron-type reverse transcriptase